MALRDAEHLQMLIGHLEQAEQHVADGERHLESQRTVVRDLERDGHYASQAKATLAQFEEMEAMHVADRDRLRRELAQGPGSRLVRAGRSARVGSPCLSPPRQIGKILSAFQ